MGNKENIEFIDNAASGEHYICVIVDVSCVLKSWRDSLFSFEWLSPEGEIKSSEELSEQEQPKRASVEEKLHNGKPIEKPILGIGLQDNIEIGSGRAEFLTLAAHGLKEIPVHIPKSNESDFKDFLADVNS